MFNTHSLMICWTVQPAGKLYPVTQLYDFTGLLLKAPLLFVLSLNFTQSKINIQQWNSISRLPLIQVGPVLIRDASKRRNGCTALQRLATASSLRLYLFTHIPGAKLWLLNPRVMSSYKSRTIIMCIITYLVIKCHKKNSNELRIPCCMCF